MSISIINNYELNASVFLDSRRSIASLNDLKRVSQAQDILYPYGFEVFCVQEGSYYVNVSPQGEVPEWKLRLINDEEPSFVSTYSSQKISELLQNAGGDDTNIGINDNEPSPVRVYSSQKVESVFAELRQESVRIDDELLDIDTRVDYLEGEMWKIYGFDGSYDSLTNKPSLENYATKEYVDEAVANNDGGSGNVDLSDYATKEYVDEKVAQSDWDVTDPESSSYVKNRTHGEFDDAWVVYVDDEFNISQRVNEYGYDNGGIWDYVDTSTLKHGEIMRVTFEGQQYECAVRKFNNNFYFGKGSAVGYRGLRDENLTGIDDDVPFFCALHTIGTSTDRCKVNIYVQPHKLYYKYSFKLERKGKGTVKLDEKYLPELIGKRGYLVGAETFNHKYNEARGEYSHAEGQYTCAYGYYSHAEGRGYDMPANDINLYILSDEEIIQYDNDALIALGEASHAEGLNNIAIGDYSHAEGSRTIAKGGSSHSEGSSTRAIGNYSHAEGDSTIASDDGSHAEGMGTIASGMGSHAEGSYTTASNYDSHAEGYYTIASGEDSHAEGCETTASGNASHSEGCGTIASSENQHVQGRYNIEDTEDKYAHIVGNGEQVDTDEGTQEVRSNAHTLDWDGNAWFAGNVSIGADNKELATKEYVDEAVSNISTGDGSGDTGAGSDVNLTDLVVTNSISMGRKEDSVIGEQSVAVGSNVKASGYSSHAEGYYTTASGGYSHAEGGYTTASGYTSHAEGYSTKASSVYSHSEGYYTIASGNYQHVQGKYNIEDTTNTYAHIVGNGAYDNTTNWEIVRSNAYTLDWDGNAWYAGNVTIGADNKELATTEYVDDVVDGAGFTLAEGTEDSPVVLNSLTTGVIYKVTGYYKFIETSERLSLTKPMYINIFTRNSTTYSYVKFNSTGTNPCGIYVVKLEDGTYTYNSLVRDTQVLTKTNTTEYTPISDYHPTTKKYVDDVVEKASNIDLNDLELTNSLTIGTRDNETGGCSLSIGDYNEASGWSSVAIGEYALSTGTYSFALGYNSISKGTSSFSAGEETKAYGDGSHAEGGYTKANGDYSHAEGYWTNAGKYAHAEGNNTTASGESSHTEGIYTKANGEAQHVQGKYNIEDTANTYAHIVGNGSSTAKSNAHTLDWNGNAWFAGNVSIGEDNKELATKEYVDEAVANLSELKMNIVNGLTFANAYINYNNGDYVSGGSAYACQEYIPVISGATYKVSGVSNIVRIAYYDSSKAYINQYVDNTPTFSFTPPSNASYIRVHVDNTSNAWQNLSIESEIENYIRAYINNATSGGSGNVDLSLYALKTDLHSHSNKSVIDTITSDMFNKWNQAIPFNDTYVSDCNAWLTNGYVKTGANQTSNLPSACTGSDRWGILFFIAENVTQGTGTQMYFPIDGTYKGRIFTRSLTNMKASGSSVGEWNLISVSDVSASSLTNESTIPTIISDINTSTNEGYIDGLLAKMETLEEKIKALEEKIKTLEEKE